MSHNEMSAEALEIYKLNLQKQYMDSIAWIEQAEEWLSEIKLTGEQYVSWRFVIRMDGARPYMQIICDEDTCNMTGEPMGWSSRKWFLSTHMVKTEFVRTAYKVFVGAVMHEADEQFTYQGQTIFDPHMNVDKLAELRSLGEEAIEAREPINV